MGNKMTWKEIKKSFPNEWVAIAHYRKESEAPFGEIIGDVVAHSSDESEFTASLKAIPENDFDIRFTGDVLPENPIGPVLWQM
ncbi:MAG: hypothetical protein ABH859_02455 [Pseudomonadota bacterium]